MHPINRFKPKKLYLWLIALVIFTLIGCLPGGEEDDGDDFVPRDHDSAPVMMVR